MGFCDEQTARLENDVGLVVAYSGTPRRLRAASPAKTSADASYPTMIRANGDDSKRKPRFMNDPILTFDLSSDSPIELAFSQQQPRTNLHSLACLLPSKIIQPIFAHCVIYRLS